MPSFTTILPVLVTLLAAIPHVGALGCYNSGLTFNSLHSGRDHNLRQEVLNDIHTTCSILNGATFRKNDPPFARCTNWAKTFPDNEDCYETCINGCNAFMTESGKSVCRLNCNPNCERKPGGTNHINWAVKLNKGEAKRMTYDICRHAFEVESGACASGSEQVWDDFWFKIDPTEGAC